MPAPRIADLAARIGRLDDRELKRIAGAVGFAGPAEAATGAQDLAFRFGYFAGMKVRDDPDFLDRLADALAEDTDARATASARAQAAREHGLSATEREVCDRMGMNYRSFAESRDSIAKGQT